MKTVFDPRAACELNDAVDYYDDLSFGLGKAFKDEVASAISIIEKYPEIGYEERPSIRRFTI